MYREDVPMAERVLLIDGRALIDQGPLALAIVDGKPLIDRWVDTLQGIPGWQIQVLTNDQAVAAHLGSLHVTVTDDKTALERSGYPWDLQNWVYPHELKRALKSTDAVLPKPSWRIETGSDLTHLETMIVRERWSPLGRWVAQPLGRSIAHRLRHTFITPNLITLFCLLLGIAAATAIWFNNPLLDTLAGVLIVAFLVFDTADGHLARLKGMSSRFGAFLDGMVDEINELLIHVALLYRISFSLDIPPATALIFYFTGRGLYGHFLHSRPKDREPTTSADPSAITSKPRAAVWLRQFGAWEVRLYGLSFTLLFSWLYPALPGLLVLAIGGYFHLFWVAGVAYLALRERRGR
jgi:phosphatidylglycerophosphate synthase